MPIPAAVLQLIENFQQNREDLKSTSYNETELRREFLDPFFTALGWNVDNSGPTGGKSAAQRDVKHEYSLKIEGDAEGETKNRAPDYAFRIGEVDEKPVFFVEAKKPSVNIRDSDKFAFQTREYGWNAGLPFCILTDFEEFAVYDCRFKPVVTEGAEKARVEFFTFDQYAENWDKIEALFGRDAVKSGALARKATLERGKGRETVNAVFLATIGKWRELLAKNLVRNNPDLESADLNFAVQMTIDRIIFLRMAEDRDLEKWGTLQTIGRGTQIYAALLERFQDADDRYNSGLFHFPNARRSGKKRPGFEDTLSPSLAIEDHVLAPILTSLYRPSPFNFRVMPIEILGQVYEEFLGKVIRVSDTLPRVARIEDKPEVRKAGGVYYTPSYIVDAIVKQTVGALCEGKTPKQLETLRVLDPASGSGSFLIGAYGYLLNWHLAFYSKNPESHLKGRNAPLFVTPDPQDESKKVYRLTTREKKRILLNNIYGVDVDRQAVEVTKLSLLLRVLEDESNEGLRLLNEPALPDLDNNIRCGNSLIGPDFYDTTKNGIDIQTLDIDEQNRINVFDWPSAFPEVMRSGGFDAVIGNPPYRRERDFKHLMDEIARTGFGQNYRAPRMDLWYYFVHRGLALF